MIGQKMPRFEPNNGRRGEGGEREKRHGNSTCCVGGRGVGVVCGNGQPKSLLTSSIKFQRIVPTFRAPRRGGKSGQYTRDETATKMGVKQGPLYQ